MSLPLSGKRPLACAFVLLALHAPASRLTAQVIEIKTLPLATGDQFAFFPSANQAMGGVSIALSDSLLDPFVNPAKGARTHAMRFFGSPTFYTMSRAAGGGQTLPVGGLLSNGRTFGGVVLAMQQVSPAHHDPVIPVPLAVPGGPVTPFPAPAQNRTQNNQYAFATLGSRLGGGFSVAGSVLYANLHRMDGVDQLYAGSQSVAQAGGDLDARLGLVRDWTSGASFEAIVLRERLRMTHDVTFADPFYDPNTRFVSVRPRLERNLDRTNTWGLHLGWQRPVGDSGWRVGAIATGNLLSHPKLPNYQIVDIVRPVPWDPGHSAAYNFGVGVAQRQGASTFALDLVYEPIVTHTWGEAPTDLQRVDGGTIPAGGKTTENHFRFSNAIARLGLGRNLPLDGTRDSLRLQIGIAAHSTHYWLRQVDHVGDTSRRQEEQWLEWTPTWGAAMRFGGVDVRYLGRVQRGTGRPGIDAVFRPVVDVALANSIVAAPSGPLTLTPVSVWTHQLSIGVPLP